MLTLGALVLGFILDLLIGDPHFLYHPIRLVGNLISVTEKGLRKIFPKTEKGELTAGVFLVLIVTGISTAVPCLLLYGARRLNPWLYFAVQTVMCYQLLATRSLKDESMKVCDRLKAEDLPGARYAVSMIVGRDTQVLDETGVTKAAVETVAENTSDGIIAPMLFLAIGGAGLGYFYKSINTMDSMVGYKNEKYLYFGRAAAKLDDVVNFLPSRISALLMIAACTFTGLDRKNAFRIWKRDRFNHASPNSAQTEAVMAGALGVQLAGDAWYFGTLCKKKTIGDAIRPVEYEDIRRANRLLYGTAVLALVVFSFVRWLVV
jgi:adenosylcobinamide-phosphate synthase